LASINRDVWKKTSDPKKIALVIAGAGSLGSYEAGVLAELTYALGVLNQSLEPLDGPLGPKEGGFVIDAVTGASAGGMNAAILARVAMYESERRDRLHTAWVKQINIDDLLEDDPRQQNALLSKNIVRKIAEAHLLDAAPANLNPASFAPDDLRVGLTLTHLNGLDYRVLTKSLNSSAPGFLTTRFSDQDTFRFKRDGFGEVEWGSLTDCAIATGNFPLAFMPQVLMRNATDYPAEPPPTQTTPPSPPGKSYFPHGLAFIDGGMFDNEPLGMAINFAADIDAGPPDPERLFLLVHPNITLSDHRDETDEKIGFLSEDLGLAAQAKRLLNMLMTENAVSDWVRANKVNDRATWRDEFVHALGKIVKDTAVEDPQALMDGLNGLADVIARKKAKVDPAAYRSAALRQIQKRVQGIYDELGAPGQPPTLRQQIFPLILFILDHVADLQGKAPLWLEVIGHDPALPLAGSQVSGFAGFFNEEWRAYDYRRGRVDARAAFTGGAEPLRALLGDYPPEPLLQQPSKPAAGEPDEYTTDRDLWRARLQSPNFPLVTFDDIDKGRQKAFSDRIGDRVKTMLGISGLTAVIFDLFIKPKIDKLLRGNPP
jgi:predicted acylesterase/phospholipase RssA